MPMLTLRQLQYLVALADERHFGKAAAKCCVTQPALSMQIKELEADLGVQLIERKRGNLELTQEGEEIAERARSVLSTVRDLIECAERRSRLLCGELSLGIIPTVAPYLLPRVLPHIQATYRELRLRLHESLTADLIGSVIQGTLDGAIVTCPINENGVESILLFEDKLLLARRRSTNASRGRFASLKECRGDNVLVLQAGHCLRDQTLQRLGRKDIDGREGLGASSLPTLLNMVANGYGVTLVPEIACASEMISEEVEILRFKPPEPVRKVVIVWRKTSTRKKDLMALASLISEALKSRCAAPAGRRISPAKLLAGE